MEGCGGFRESLCKRIQTCSATLDFSGALFDPRNGVLVVQATLMLALVLPSSLLLFAHFSFVHAALHVALVLFVCAETFTAVLHNTSHRPLFKPHLGALNLVIPYVMAPFLGQTWNTYYFHHCKHHHVEDNGPDDLSSTAIYQRDSALHFAIYFLRFLLCVQVELTMYFVKRRQYGNAAKMLGGELSSLAAFCALTWWRPLPGLAVFIVPLLVMRFGMMAANWGQHAFVRPLTIVDASYNTVAFNDGYHLSHHHNPLRHWSEHPQYRPAQQQEVVSSPLAPHIMTPMSERDSADSMTPITLRGLSFGDVWLLLMWRDYGALADRYVHTGSGCAPSRDAIVRLLRAQTCPAAAPPHPVLPAQR